MFDKQVQVLAGEAL